MREEDDPDTTDGQRFTLRTPRPEDGVRMWRLARSCPPLEANTCYAYVLLSTHFADTCVIAEREGEAVGYVAAYCPPTTPEAIFVWQIGVSEAGRGQGLGAAMLRKVTDRARALGRRYLDTTITPSNGASRGLFASFARKLGAAHEVTPFMGEALFPQGHEAEDLIRIGPLPGTADRADQPREDK